jgi:hypothetical protein
MIIPLRVKLTTDRPKPEFTNPLPVMAKLAGGVARLIEFGVMEATPGTGRVSVTVSEVLPTKLQLFDPVWFQTSKDTGPALKPGYNPLLLGNGMLRLVFVPEEARTAAIALPLRMKLTTDSPKLEFTNPLPAMVKLAGGIARLIEFGVMELTPGGGRVSLTVREVLPTKLQLFDPVWLYTSAVIGPALQPEFVGKETVRLVLVPELARAAAMTRPLRVKLTTDRPKPEFTNPLPVMVKLAGGEARLIELGVTEVTNPFAWLNLAVTEVSALIFNMHVPVPLHTPPIQPVNVYPDAGVAVSVTEAPLE